MKNKPTPTSIMEFKNTNKIILFPLSKRGILKYKTLKSITIDSNKNITEKHVANLCIKTAFSSLKNKM